MKTLITLALLVGSCSLLLHDVAGAHGGTYRGPGSTVPPGGGGSSGGGSGGSSSSTGGSTSGGSSQGSGPAAPAGGSGSGGGSAQGGSSSPSGPSIPTAGSGATWEPWWAFNRDPFLNLKAVIHENDPHLGSDSYFLGHVPLDLVRDQLRPTEEDIRAKIVPALWRVLEKETDNDLVTGALVALAKIGDDPKAPAGEPLMAERIQVFLKSANQEIAETAAVSLGILANDSSVKLLTALLEDDERGRALVGGQEVAWRTRAFAAYGLGLIGFYTDNIDSRRVILSVLRESLEGDAAKMATPDVAVACLTAMGLIRLDVELNCAVVSGSCLGPSHCRRGQLDWLRDFGKQNNLNYVIRSHVPTTLARLTKGTGQDPLLKGQVSKDLLVWASTSSKVQRHLRASSIMAVGSLGSSSTKPIDQEIISALKRTVANSRLLEVRTLALVALGQVGARRNSAGVVDAEVVADVREFLLKQFTDGRSTDRGWAALGLSLLEGLAIQADLQPSAKVAEEVRNALKQATTPGLVGAYAVSLGVMQDHEAAEVILEKLDKLSDDRSRGYLCVGLGLMNAREGIEPMRKILKDSRYRPLLMREAAISLGLLGDKNVVTDLVEELQRSNSLSAQSSIAAALGSIGDARSVAPLLAMLEDPDLNVRARAFAAVALGIVADKEPLPWNSKIAVGANYLAGTPTLTDGQGAGILDIL